MKKQATGEFSYFEIKRGEWQEELFERLDTAGRLLYRSVELSEKSVELGEETLKAMREESEKTRQTVKEESEKTREEISEVAYVVFLLFIFCCYS